MSPDRTVTFLLVTILVLVTVLLVVAIRAFARVRQAHLRAMGEEAYRELVAATASAQAAGVAALGGVQADIAEIKERLASVERILKTVE